ELLDHVADAGLVDGVPAMLEDALVVGRDVDPADELAALLGMNAHHVVVATVNVGDLLAGVFGGTHPLHVDAEGLRAELELHPVFFLQGPTRIALARDEVATVIAERLVELAGLVEPGERLIEGGFRRGVDAAEGGAARRCARRRSAARAGSS